jgi:hypothetical protein
MLSGAIPGWDGVQRTRLSRQAGTVLLASELAMSSARRAIYETVIGVKPV